MTRIGVLVSGRGGNLAAVLGACLDGEIPADVVFVGSNRPGCAALELARLAEVPLVHAFPLTKYGDVTARDRAMAEAMKAAGVELVVTAGYDRVLDEEFVSAFEGHILNVHPSLLPAFAGGMNAIEEALQAGVKETGVTVHLIEPNTVDSGRVLAQEVVQILPQDTLDSLEERIHEVEHRLLPASIGAFIESGQAK